MLGARMLDSFWLLADARARVRPGERSLLGARSLTERPEPGEVITVTVTVEDLPGNAERLATRVATRARTANFVAADFGKQFVGVINVTGAGPGPHALGFQSFEGLSCVVYGFAR
jgi:hypothetical protein